MASGSLRNMLVIDLFIVHDGLSESRDGWEPCLVQYVCDPPVDPFDHLIGVGVTRLDQVIVNALGTTDLVKRLSPRWRSLPRGTT